MLLFFTLSLSLVRPWTTLLRCCSRSCARRSFPYLNPLSLNAKSQRCYSQNVAITQKAAKSTFIYMCVCHMHCCRLCGRSTNAGKKGKETTHKHKHKHKYECTAHLTPLGKKEHTKQRILLYRFCCVTLVLLDNPS